MSACSDPSPSLHRLRAALVGWAIGLAVALAGVLVLALPLLREPGLYPLQHEELRYPSLVIELRDAIVAGQWYPRWLPNLAAGYGYPTFVFYPPLFLLAAAWLAAASSASAIEAVAATSAALAFVGAAGIYRLSRFYADRVTSSFVTLLYALTPYGFANVYVRGDLTEFAAMQLVPWCLCGASAIVARCRTKGSVRGVTLGLAAALAAVTYAHPLIAIGTWPVTGVLLVSAWPTLARRGQRTLCVAAAAAFLLGGLLSASYWLPGQLLRDEVSVDRAFEGYYVTSRHVVYPAQLFQRKYEFGGSTPDGRDDGMPFQLGALHFALAIAGAWLGRRRPLIVAACACYLASLALMSPLGRPLWDHVPVLRIFQFPWRLLAVTASLQALCIAGWASARIARPAMRVAAGTVVLAAAFVWHEPQLRLNPNARIPLAEAERYVTSEARRTPFVWQTHSGREEFLPRGVAQPVRLPARGDRALVELRDGTLTALPGHTPATLRYRVTSASPTRATIQQFYFPGWQVRVDGAPVPPQRLRDERRRDGRMTLALPPCAAGCILEARYQGPPGARALQGIGVAATLAVGVGLGILDRRLRASPG